MEEGCSSGIGNSSTSRRWRWRRSLVVLLVVVITSALVEAEMDEWCNSAAVAVIITALAGGGDSGVY